MKFLYQVGSEIGFPSTYPLDIDLSTGLRYAAFEQLAGPIHLMLNVKEKVVNSASPQAFSVKIRHNPHGRKDRSQLSFAVVLGRGLMKKRQVVTL